MINITLANFISSGNTSDDGAIKNLGDDLFMSGVTIKGSSPQKGGSNPVKPALIWNRGNNFIIKDSFIDNPGTFAGPARTIYNTGDYLTVDNLTLINPNRYGVDNFGNYFTLKNSYFINTIPNATSSMVCCPVQTQNGNHILIINSSFSNFPCCPVALEGTNITVSDSIFLNNTESISNGASNLTIKNSYFEYNRGAAITNDGGNNILIINNTFKNCEDSVINNAPSANNSHPGINITVKDSSFENSMRAIKNAGENFTVINSNFTNNNGDFGAAIYNTGKNLIVDNSIFKNNKADNGGAICQDNGTITIKNSKFINNIASNGGAILSEHGNLSIFDSQFEKNTAIDIGGTISLYGDSLTVTNSNFTNNKVFKDTEIHVFGGSLLENKNSYDSHLKIIKIAQIGEKIIVQVKVTGNANGSILPNQNIILTIGGKTLNAKTNSKGVAEFKYTPLKSGNLKANIQLKNGSVGSLIFKGSTASSSVKFVKPAPNFKQVNKIEITKKGKNYIVKVQWKNIGTKKGIKKITIDLKKYKSLKKYKFAKGNYNHGKKISLKNEKLIISFDLPIYKSKKDLGIATITLKKI
ncbi:right-handed parallel beta-helix repeat-containing protein [Methanobrevibacter filiformis]|uniref:Uncharacterized protein n=1 Tax=Methanobrevibacter filiformis TaxID=55758 RepID=A0A166EWP3_9EURY|nr:right-handed parallel beta-helix repeat-containing protein [Methanobrevibacter filiformis]KZX17093.1 hypothetical protein MBFIL_03430 [Methanobrevibacter filiformis]